MSPGTRSLIDVQYPAVPTHLVLFWKNNQVQVIRILLLDKTKIMRYARIRVRIVKLAFPIFCTELFAHPLDEWSVALIRCRRKFIYVLLLAKWVIRKKFWLPHCHTRILEARKGKTTTWQTRRRLGPDSTRLDSTSESEWIRIEIGYDRTYGTGGWRDGGPVTSYRTIRPTH